MVIMIIWALNSGSWCSFLCYQSHLAMHLMPCSHSISIHLNLVSPCLIMFTTLWLPMDFPARATAYSTPETALACTETTGNTLKSSQRMAWSKKYIKEIFANLVETSWLKHPRTMNLLPLKMNKSYGEFAWMIEQDYGIEKIKTLRITPVIERLHQNLGNIMQTFHVQIIPNENWRITLGWIFTKCNYASLRRAMYASYHYACYTMQNIWQSAILILSWLAVYQTIKKHNFLKIIIKES